ncbi:MAG: phosphate--acyl-ACP acyltransferase, partial [Acidobacteria bacterium]|nr:phosphate--acyl-ACP acyltransferase [Acidobacteriota bacterium]
MRRIVVDAMGSEGAPGPELDGAILAARERWAEITLVGPADLLKRELAR